MALAPVGRLARACGMLCRAATRRAARYWLGADVDGGMGQATTGEDTTPAGSGELAGTDWPRVTVIVLSYNGRRHLEQCLPTLLAQRYPADRLDLMIVDNDSRDGSADYVERAFPTVRVIRNRGNYGFARGNNIGVQHAQGEFVALLNQDTRVEPTWVAELVAPILRDRSSGDGMLVCVGAKMLSWDGETIDFAGARMNFLGKASQVGSGEPAASGHDQASPILFPCGGAMLIERRVFLESGGFDEDYFVFFEDVDLGWRLWVLGYRVELAPRAIAYHRVHASTGELQDVRKRLIYERNALYSVLKNYDDANLARVFPASVLLTLQVVLAELQEAGVEPARYAIQHRGEGIAATVPVRSQTISLILALREVMERLPSVMERRASIQSRRRRPDSEILPLFGGPLEPMATEGGFAEMSFALAQQLGIATMFENTPRHVLVLAGDVLPVGGLPTSGAGLRAWAIGEGLKGRGHRVTFAMHKVVLKHGADAVPAEHREAAWDEQTLNETVASVKPDIIVSCGWYPAIWLERGRIPIAIDQHGPHMLERGFHKDHPIDFVTGARQKLMALSKADFFSCAGDRQRHYFEPWLMQAGFDLTRPEEQPHVMPLSLSPDLPAHEPEGEPTFVYGGVFLPWQDPSAALTTLVETLERHGRGRLTLFGGAHPIFQEIGTGVFPRLRARLEGSSRATFEPMIAHAELLRRYARAHVAIDLMKRNAERELAFTTRTVEYLWCGLPVIYNDYSELSDYIADYEAGWTLDPDDQDGLRAVIETILTDPQEVARRGRNAQRLVRERLTYDRTIEPLDAFCRSPRMRSHERAPLPEQAAFFVLDDDEIEADAPAAESEAPATARPLLEAIARRRRAAPARAVARLRGAVKRVVRPARPVVHSGIAVQTASDLIGGRVHAQSFEATEDHLSAVAVRFGTYARLNTQEIVFRLFDERALEAPLREVSVNASLARDGAFHAFRFAPVEESKGRRFRFSLQSPSSIEGDAVTLWWELRAPEPSEVRHEDGLPAPGRLSFRLEYRPPRKRRR